MLEDDDKLVTKTEDASMGIRESIEDEKPLTESGETSESNQDLLKESHDRQEVNKAVEEDIKKEEPVIRDRNLGSVEGKDIAERKTSFRLPGKGKMLEKGGLLTKGYHPVEGAVENETVTDNEGVYRFANVSPGLYKL